MELLKKRPAPADWVIEIDPTPPPRLQAVDPNPYTVEGNILSQGAAARSAKQGFSDRRRWVRWGIRIVAGVFFGLPVAAAVLNALVNALG